jgi:prevent-host-death family protein
MRKPTATETLPFTAARANLSQLVNRVHRGDARVVIEKNGVPVAALVSIDDVCALATADGSREQILDILDPLKTGAPGMTEDEIMDLAVREVRAPAGPGSRSANATRPEPPRAFDEIVSRVGVGLPPLSDEETMSMAIAAITDVREKRRVRARRVG